MKIAIADRIIGPGEPVFVIAEAGVNHNQRLDFALRLVDVAVRAGADAVKFQTFRGEDLVTGEASMAGYQARNIGRRTSQLAMLKKVSLPESFYPKIVAHCRKRGIVFISTPHSGIPGIQLLQRYHVPAFKFGSADLTNLPALDYAARTGKPLIISTGMGTMAEIREAVRCVRRAGNQKIILLQCTTDYPLDHDEVNLRAMETIRRTFGTVVGYSDHTRDPETAVMAVTLGASAIEKHITLSKKLPGPDHKASAEPDEFREYVRQIREVPIILGDGKKRPMPSERQYIPIVRKSIIIQRPVKKGERLSAKNLTVKRPKGGIHPREWWRIIGKTATRNLSPDTILRRSDFR